MAVDDSVAYKFYKFYCLAGLTHAKNQFADPHPDIRQYLYGTMQSKEQ